jgi:hypothetical protein
MINSISIITPIYNNNIFLNSYFESISKVTSILRKGNFNFEYILIDDFSDVDFFHSLENRFNILDISEKRLIRNTENIGTYSSYWKGIKESQKDYILIVDSDDELSIYLNEFLENYEGNDELIIFGDNYSNIHTEPDVFRSNLKSELLSLMLSHNKFINLLKIIKREVLLKNSILRNGFRFAPDFHISAISIASSKRIHVDGNELVKVNRRADSVSRQYSQSYHKEITELFSSLFRKFIQEKLELELFMKLELMYYEYLLYDLIATPVNILNYHEYYLRQRANVILKFNKLKYLIDKQMLSRNSIKVVHTVLFYPTIISYLSILILMFFYRFKFKISRFFL